MELILINKNTLKIMLDEGDMKKYHIGSESDCAEGETRRAIRSLLECAKDKIGFDTDGEEIFVQLYTSKQGGCELFVTKCDGSRASRGELSRGVTSRGVTSQGAPSRALIEAPERKTTQLAYSFDSLASLIKVCSILDGTNFSGESSAYNDGEGRFYLLISSPLSSVYMRLDALTFIVEFGRRVPPDVLLNYLSERGKPICESNAVETLGKL